MHATICPNCRTLTPADGTDGLCPACLLAGASSDPQADLEPSREELAELFPELELGERLGGNMGVVYRGRHRELDRAVALKLFPAGRRADRDRFRREAGTLAGLRHPNVVTVYDAGRADGLDFFVMEYVDGETLRRAAARLPAAPAERAAVIAGWVGAICDGLAHAHAHGVVHRDVKPENVIVRADGVPVLIDFGLAKGRRHAPLTRDAQGMGSGNYAAPEQWADAATADARSDVYAVGVMLHELWTGQSSVGQLPPPDPAAPPLDRAVLAVARRAMAHQPTDRYPTADALRLALRAAVERPLARPSARKPRPGDYYNGWHVLAGLLILAAVLGLVGILSAGGWSGHPRSAGTSPTTSVAKASDAPKSRGEAVLADLQSDDWKVRETAVERFAKLDPDELECLRKPLRDVLLKRLDADLFRFVTSPPADADERERQRAAFQQSDRHSRQRQACREPIKCYEFYLERERLERLWQELATLSEVPKFTPHDKPRVPPQLEELYRKRHQEELTRLREAIGTLPEGEWRRVLEKELKELEQVNPADPSWRDRRPPPSK